MTWATANTARYANSMPFARFITSQLSHPRGLFGRHLMARLFDAGNDELISGTLAALALESRDCYLDIGFGGGASLRKAAAVIGTGRIYGLDHSSDMVARAQKQFEDAIHRGAMILQQGDVHAMPFASGSMTKISAIKTLYFWEDALAGIVECARVLAPGGRIAAGISGPAKLNARASFTRHGIRVFDPNEVADLFRRGGLQAVQVIPQFGRVSQGDYVITAEKAPIISQPPPLKHN
jgi:ubiquinone/menaquinone biosynthesis C-methylase UbiE